MRTTDDFQRDDPTDTKIIEYIAFDANQIKSATDNNGIFSTENDDIQMAISKFVDKYSLPKGELPALSKALSAKFSNNTAYGDVINTANYEYTVIYRGGGFRYY
jgi:hypothetical protein